MLLPQVMYTSCLVNNYNYGRFVLEAVDSALAQTTPFDEILVVDDGSTDDSLSRLKREYGENRRVKVISKENGGQLSCFNEGFAASRGDLVCFLDADDVYQRDYLQNVLQVYEEHPEYDAVFSSSLPLGQGSTRANARIANRDFGYSVIVTLCLRKWIGAPTSCISMRRRVLDGILPIPYLSDWRTRADDCLVFGSSLVGARKFHLAEPLVRYRIHGDNHFAGRKPSRVHNYQRKLALNRLFDLLITRHGFDRDRLPEFAHREFQTVGKPTFRQMCEYVKIPFQSRVRWGRKLGIASSIAAYFFFGIQR